MATDRRARVGLGVVGALVVLVTGALVHATRTSSGPAAGTVARSVAVVALPTDVVTGPTTGATPSGPRPSGAWVERVAAATTIPARALEAYAAAQLQLAVADPGCHLGWNTLAGIGAVESDHGRHGGAAVGPDGMVRLAVRGPALDGSGGNRAVSDTDGGRLDGDPTWDRAMGPMQFIPTTWGAWGRSAHGGVPDPDDIDDAALSAGTYLCASGADMATTAGWNRAVASYDAPVQYAVDVAADANRYAEQAS